MRRLTQQELRHVVDLARDGRTGPARALEALWDLILREAEGVGVNDAASRPGGFRVQDYAMVADQAAVIRDAMTRGRRLSRRTVAGFYQLWAEQSPADYEADDGAP